jgi:hypothetical protein
VIPDAKRKKLGITTPTSKTMQVGEAPEGFGKYVMWSDEDSQLALVVFLNAGDPMGVGVLGVKATDKVQFVAAVGHASFSESTENKGVPAMIGIVAAGGNVTAAAFGFPEAAPVIKAGSAYAKEQFKEKNVKTMVRDPYGEDPSSHHKAKKEGASSSAHHRRTDCSAAETTGSTGSRSPGTGPTPTVPPTSEKPGRSSFRGAWVRERFPRPVTCSSWPGTTNLRTISVSMRST